MKKVLMIALASILLFSACGGSFYSKSDEVTVEGTVTKTEFIHTEGGGVVEGVVLKTDSEDEFRAAARSGMFATGFLLYGTVGREVRLTLNGDDVVTYNKDHIWKKIIKVEVL